MKNTRSFLGFMVVEKCEDYEQPLGLNESPSLPPGGILEWTDGRRAVFLSRKEAREAIQRTHHYRLAFRSLNHPEKKFCVIVPVEHVKPKSTK